MENLNTLWFQNNLLTGSSLSFHPKLTYIVEGTIEYDRLLNRIYKLKDQKIEIIINVDSNFDPNAKKFCNIMNIDYYWFPINEHYGDIGINSIFAAMNILFLAEKKNNKVYVHCAAGVNRSPTIKECYYFMRTGQYNDNILVKSDPNIQQMFKGHENETHYIQQNVLLRNIENKFLPSKNQMEIFLSELHCQLQDNSVCLESLKSLIVYHEKRT